MQKGLSSQAIAQCRFKPGYSMNIPPPESADKMWRCKQVCHYMPLSNVGSNQASMVLYSPPRNKKYVCTASMIMTSYSPPRMIFVSSTTIYSSRNSGLVGKSCKVQHSLTRVYKKSVYVASGIETATINLCHNIIFLRLIASYKVQNFGIKNIRQQSIRHTNLVNTSVENTETRNFQEIYI